nr:hypothetical protein [Tanacetum cinerariifolium]
MSGPVELNLTPPTSAVRNTVGKEKQQTSKNTDRHAFDAAFREYCDKHYHQLLPIRVEKVHNEKVQQEKMKEVKARLNFEGCSGRNSKIHEISQYSESRTPNKRGDLRRRLKPIRSRSMSRSPEPTNVFSRIRRDRSASPRHRQGDKRRKPLSGSEDSEGGHWKSRSRKQKSSIEEEDLSQPWTCEETDPFTPRIRYFELPKKTRMPSNVKTYDENGDPEDHLKIFQAAAKVESYDDLKGIPSNFLQQKKCIKDLVEIHYIKQREGESIEDFTQRFKAKSRHVKRAPECMRIFGFMYGITNPELIKRLHDNIPKSVDEMMRVTTAFLIGEVAASNQPRKKTLASWKQQEVGRKQNFDRKRDFRNQQRSERRRDKFTLLTKSPKEYLALDKGDEDGTEGPMIIEAEIGGHFTHRMYVDGGLALEVLYGHCFIRLRPKVKSQMVSATVAHVGFSGEIIWPMRQISLPVKIGDDEHFTSSWINFMVVRSPSPYNGIIGRLGVRRIQAVPSTDLTEC